MHIRLERVRIACRLIENAVCWGGKQQAIMDNSEFDWTTEDELVWETDSAESQPSAPRRWVMPLLIVLILLAAGAVYWQLQRRVRLVEQQTEADVRASVDLLLEASAKQDLELFNSLLSGRDMGWVAAQQAMVRGDGLLDRLAYALTLRDEAPQIEQLVLSPDLFSAEITLTVPYDAANLQLPLHFRQGTTRWLYSPPPDEFWGDEIIRESVYLIARYPARDAALIDRLIADLDELIRKSGTVEYGFYPPERQIQVTFSADSAQRTRTFYDQAGDILVLPTPSLIGLPQDDQGYAALLAYYAHHVYAPILAASSPYQCCHRVAYFEALLNWELAQYGVRPWSLTADDWATLGARSDQLDKDLLGWHASRLDEVDENERLLAHAIVEYLQTPEYHSAEPVDVTEMLLSLNLETSTTTGQFSFWLSSFMRRQVYRSNAAELNTVVGPLVERWFQEAARAPLPSESLVAACEWTSGWTHIVEYVLGAPYWNLVDDIEAPIQYIRPLPDQNGLWLGFEGWEASILGNDGMIIDVPGRLRYDGVHSSDNRMLTASRVNATGQALDSESVLIGLDACSAESCPATARSGQVEWSSNGQYQMLRDFANSRVMVVDSDGTILKTVSLSPQTGRFAWLDSDTIVWRDENGGYVQSDVMSDVVTPWLSYAELRPILPAEPIESSSLRIYNAGSTRNPDLKLIQVFDNLTPRYMLMLDPATGELNRIPELDNTFFVTASRHGRWLVSSAFEISGSSQQFTELILFDRGMGNTAHYPINNTSRVLFPNSTDEWVMVYEPEKIRLIAPAYEYVRYLLPPSADCSAAAWLNVDR